MKKILVLLLISASALGASAPSFRGELLGGGKTSLEQALPKDKLLLVSFWATWCVPCMEELTHVRDYLEKNPTFPLAVLTINVDDEQRSEVAATVKQMKLPFAVVMDGQKEILRKYHKDSTLPFSVIVAPSREILAKFNGYHESMFKEIAELAKKLPAASAAKPAPKAKP